MYEYKELYTIDLREVKTFFEFHFAIKEAFNFPNYYGCNWDAFWDCLTDMIGGPIHIEIIGLDNAERKLGHEFVETMIDTLRDLKHYDNDNYTKEIQIEIVRNIEVFVV